ncbi:hypothetical protein BJX65DRAFT_85148 [Aspergillus insuetus]
MASTPVWPALVAAVFVLFSLASAQVCDLNPNYYYIDRPEQLEELSRNCTTLHGWLYTQDNFTGSFALPRVTNITGALTLNGRVTPGLTNIELPDLEFAYDLRLYGVQNVSLPRLSEVELGLEISSRSDGIYNFPSLISADRISLSGNLSSVSFEALRNASTISIENRASDYYYHRNLTSTVVDISFPVLERVGDTHLRGNISSFSAPELTTIAPAGNYGSAMLWVEPYEPGVSLDLPKLAFVNGSVQVDGVINAVSLPLLRNITGDFTLITLSAEPIALDLPIEYTNEVELRGNIDSVALPNLRNYSTIRFFPWASFDCEGLGQQLNGTVSPPVVEYENFFCSGAETFSSKPRIVLGIVMVASLLNIIM